MIMSYKFQIMDPVNAPSNVLTSDPYAHETYTPRQQYDAPIGPRPAPASQETPWLLWAGLAVGAYFLFGGKKTSRRRRR